MNLLRYSLLSSIAIATLASSGQLNAELIVEETFESYTEGSLAYQNAAGKGLTGVWSGNEAHNITAGALSADHGKSLQIQPTGKWLSVKLAQESLVGAAPGSTVSIAFNMKLESAQAEKSQAFISFAENNLDAKGTLRVGQMWGRSNWGISQGPPSSKPIDTDTHTILVVVTRAGGNALQASLYIDPVNPERLPLSAQKPDATGWPKVNDFKQISFKANGNGFLVDDIRIGPDPASVLKQ